jgi:hypothetical protein
MCVLCVCVCVCVLCVVKDMSLLIVKYKGGFMNTQHTHTHTDKNIRKKKEKKEKKGLYTSISLHKILCVFVLLFNTLIHLFLPLLI